MLSSPGWVFWHPAPKKIWCGEKTPFYLQFVLYTIGKLKFCFVHGIESEILLSQLPCWHPNNQNIALVKLVVSAVYSNAIGLWFSIQFLIDRGGGMMFSFWPSRSKPSNSSSRALSLNILSNLSCSWRKSAAILLKKHNRPSRTEKRIICLLIQWRKNGIPYDMILLTSLAVVGWFACKSLCDWVRYVVIVMFTGKSGIYQGQPVPWGEATWITPGAVLAGSVSFLCRSSFMFWLLCPPPLLNIFF